MTPVLHLRRRLDRRPVVTPAPDVGVRHFTAPDDVPDWLTLRARATAGLSPPVRPWTPDDFQAEMLTKPWWRDNRTWLAIAGEPRSPVGAVTLAERAGALGTAPIVHWLLVDPAWRRRGVGRLLMSYLEQAAWDAGWREIQLETHTGWAAAVAFYRALGYVPVAEINS